ncbi:hypothetical protein A1O1_08243 [Capronia coronata CBS 617.96]|uniref:Urea active transporter n=1 Tax=Capronia coronata CBS 617.96 TaxID=1182541 RepID=W9YIP9_9EURO|nr:uncharacterized protein A1O1_08243 [Capronia coronata CBS 617.96]EXJ82174.1 hypothetical protein A1O1_08243 [Capronia coronata CBS 617.96]
MADASSVSPPLSEAFGYGILIGLGIAFALFMIVATWALKRYHNEVQTSEAFNTAGRTVKSGLVASAVVSSWTWAATLLQSSGVAYNYGISGPFWYASGATVQIILFATLAIELKRRAPNAHTFLEAVRARYGKITHLVFLTFGLMTNILVTAMLVTGGSAVVESLSGVPTAAGSFLLPFGVVLYTIFGGLKATLLSDWTHGLVVLVIIILFSFSAYATNEELGSPGRVWDLLVEASARHPVDGNREGSYLTMRSHGGAIFFVINIVGNFGTVFLDNGYYNKAIAASPVDALPVTSTDLYSGLSWFAIPWLCATTMGLAALALENSPSFPTFPERIPPSEVSAGLVLPYASQALLGSGGAAASFLLIFFAVTSAYSSELIAVSSIFTYDIYQTYINPNANGKFLIRMSHLSCIVYALIMAGFGIGLFYAGVGMGYLYLMMGCIISSAVIPATLTLTWKDQNWIAAAVSPVLGLACSLTAWLVTARRECGELTIACTGSNYPMLAGNVTALLSPLIFVPVLTYSFGRQNYDWQSMKTIRRGDDSELIRRSSIDPEVVHAHVDFTNDEQEQAHLNRAAKIARVMTVVMTLCFLILWPMPLYGSGYIFSKPFFTGWVVVGFIWIFCTTACVGVFPLWQGRKTMTHITKAMWDDLTGKKSPAFYGTESREARGNPNALTTEMFTADKAD